ncbi:amino acid adenylation domain-containing protein [Streptomyces sp. NPDC050287]|uniref:amino acid adenylation domain-containing protein n=1 Tax=Streptomyces sp. NPDC050287 TaxID=3365608 RepID=UPI0037B9F102
MRRTAKRFPDHVAVECPEGELTYAALEARSDHLARTLQAAGAVPGTVIPVIAEDRREVIVAILGVLKARGVFAPLDPSGPHLRTAAMLSALSPELAVVGATRSERDLRTVKNAAPSASVITLDLNGSCDGTPVETLSAPDDECYIFFTSGSTGHPKGIVGRLRAVDHYVQWETGLVGVREGWRVSHLASPAFDAMLRDVFVPLCAGGTVCVPPRAARTDARELIRWLDTRRISLVHCVPSVFRGIAAAATSSDCELASLKWIAMAGERLAPRDVGLWFDRYGERIGLLNLYGPSEATMTKTYHVIKPADAHRASVPIGRPMPGAEALVIDNQRRLCQEEDVGEIYLRTPYLSHGYYCHPDATREVFVPNPLTGDLDDIVYKTGDFARVLLGGDLEFLGRKDHQVKLGGIRVELEEIESVLRELPVVKEAAVVFVDEVEVPYLCAFLELADGEFDERLARSRLRDRLSETVAPAVLVPLPEIPRTVSGKIDRRSLPVPPPGHGLQPADTLSGPRTPTERTLTELLHEIFPALKTDVRADFLNAGGHSLLVMRLLSRLHSDFGIEVPLQAFLASPTIESLARWIDGAIPAGHTSLEELRRG